jgi:hypothetical protein
MSHTEQSGNIAGMKFTGILCRGTGTEVAFLSYYSTRGVKEPEHVSSRRNITALQEPGRWLGEFTV